MDVMPVAPPAVPQPLFGRTSARHQAPSMTSMDTVRFGRSSDDEDETGLDFEAIRKKLKGSFTSIEDAARKASRGITDATASISSIKRKANDEHAVNQLAGHANEELNETTTALSTMKREQEAIEEQFKKITDAFEEDGSSELSGKGKKYTGLGRVFQWPVRMLIGIVSGIVPGGKIAIYNKALEIKSDK